MKIKFCLAAITAMLLLPVASKAQAPAGSTGQCKDGSYTSAKSKRGACAGHGGVGSWTADGATTATKPAAPVTTPAPAPVSKPAPAPAAPVTRSAPVSVPAAGGGAGQVWVNTDSHVYHCSGSKWYGKTKAGKYLSETQAKAEGDKAAYNKPCGN